MTEIRSKVPSYGHEKEGSWPPSNPSGEKGLFYITDEGEVAEGYPPSKLQLFGKAPYIIQDSIVPFKHEGSGEIIDSRSRLRDTDRACGTITTDKLLPPDPTWQKEQRKKRLEDKKESIRKAVAQLRNGTAPISEEKRALCRNLDQQLSAKLGYDTSKLLRKKDGSWK